MNQRVLVAAGVSGIGREIVRAFAAQGAKVFVCDIDDKALENLEQETPGVTTKVCDVSKREDIEQMVAFGVNALGGLDVLVNNAGKSISGQMLPIDNDMQQAPSAANAACPRPQFFLSIRAGQMGE